jgi:hypothetical protein
MPIKFCSEAYFFRLGVFNTRDSWLKVPPRGLMLRIFMSWINPSTSAGFESANLGWEYSRLYN